MLELDGFEYEGNPYKGSDLYNLYLNEYNKLFTLTKNELLNRLETVDGKINVDELRNLLVEETTKHGVNYSINDIAALELNNKGEFVLPLWASGSSTKFESLLNSIVDNKIRRQKIHVMSLVLGTEEGFKGDTKFKTL